MQSNFPIPQTEDRGVPEQVEQDATRGIQSGWGGVLHLPGVSLQSEVLAFKHTVPIQAVRGG